MRSHRESWVKAALDNTDADDAAEVRELIREGELQIRSPMVTEDDAIEFCEEYMADVESRCLDCEIMCFEGDEYLICPDCNRKYVP